MFRWETSAFAFYTEGSPQYFYQKRQIDYYFNLPFFNSETAKSAARAVNAIYVNDGLTQLEDAIDAPSVTKTFLQSWI